MRLAPGRILAVVFGTALLLSAMLAYRGGLSGPAVEAVSREPAAAEAGQRPEPRIVSVSQAPGAPDAPMPRPSSPVDEPSRPQPIETAGEESAETTSSPTARFIIRTDSGTPVAGAVIIVRGAEGETSSPLTDLTGTWETPLEPGSYSARAQLPEAGTGLYCKPVRFQKPRGTGIEIVIECVKSTVLAGVVSDEKGRLVANASVRASLRDGKTISTTSASDGHFALEGIPEDYWFESILVEHPEYDKARVNDVSEYEGVLDVVLKRTAVRLEVAEAETSRPATSFSYRISAADQRNTPGFEERDWTPVSSPDGSVELTGLSLGNMKFDVKAAGGSSGEGVKGGAFFYHSGKSATVRVLIGNGQSVAGIVRLKSDDTPVSGVAVSMKSDHEYFEDGGKGASRAQSVVSGDDGRFLLEGIGPGKHRLMVDVNSLRSRDLWVENEIWVDVPAGRPAAETVVQLVEGASIHGRVIGPQGEPLADAELHATTWRPVVTDSAGEFTINQVLPGNQRVFLRHKKLNIAETQDVTVLPGESKEIVFDLSQSVIVTGRITVDGYPWLGQPHLTFYRDANTRRSFMPGGEIESLGEGRYRATVPKGNHTLWIYESWTEGWPVGILTREGEAPPLVRDFDIHLNRPTAVVTFPSDTEDLPKGQITFEQRRDGLVHVGLKSIPNAREQVVVAGVPDGEYRILFASKDGLWTGESQWTPIAPGRENVLVVDLEPENPGVRVGSWNPGTVAMASRRQTFPVTEHIERPGQYLATFLWESGFASLDIYSVRLLANGQPVAQDTHQGLSGATKIGHQYRLNVSAPSPGALYELEVEIGVGVGKTSYGGIYLQTPQAEREPR